MSEIPSLWPEDLKDIERSSRPNLSRVGAALFPSVTAVTTASDGPVQVSIWNLKVVTDQDPTPLKPELREAWESVKSLSWSAPVMRTAPGELFSLRLKIEWVSGVMLDESRQLDPNTEVSEESPEAIGGLSAGLAMLLALVSHFTKKPLPSDVICTGEVAAVGSVNRVDLVKEKLLGSRYLLPGIGRFLVGGVPPLTDPAIRPVSSVSTAIEEAGFREEIRGMNAEPTSEAETIKQLALAPRALLVDWSGLVQMADGLLERSGSSLSASQQQWVKLAAAIGSRHDGQPRDLSVDPHWFLGLPDSERLLVLAHFCQHAADNYIDLPSHFENAVRSALATSDGRLPSPQDLRVWGAYGRFLARHGDEGRLGEAAGLLAAATCAWLDALLPAEASFPLCEWYRVMGALGRGLDDCHEALLRLRSAAGGVTAQNTPYLVLARERALLMTDAGDSIERLEAVRALREIASRTDAPQHVRAACWRWLAKEKPSWRNEADKYLEELGELSSKHHSGRALKRLRARARAWMEFDRLAAAGRDREARAQLGSGCDWYQAHPGVHSLPVERLALLPPYL